MNNNIEIQENIIEDENDEKGISDVDLLPVKTEDELAINKDIKFDENIKEEVKEEPVKNEKKSIFKKKKKEEVILANEPVEEIVETKDKDTKEIKINQAMINENNEEEDIWKF